MFYSTSKYEPNLGSRQKRREQNRHSPKLCSLNWSEFWYPEEICPQRVGAVLQWKTHSPMLALGGKPVSPSPLAHPAFHHVHNQPFFKIIFGQGRPGSGTFGSVRRIILIGVESRVYLPFLLQEYLVCQHLVIFNPCLYNVSVLCLAKPNWSIM